MTTDTQNDPETIMRTRDLPRTLKPLERLAWNYWWSWAPAGAEVFRDLDPGLWQQCEQNPRALLAQVSDLRLAQIAADPTFSDRVRRLAELFDTYMSDTHPSPKLNVASRINRENPVAYFCAEFGVHNSLPLYSGGLGILAGDHLKSASDLNLPLVAVGLFYRFGYFRQRLNREGWQEETYGETYPAELPICQIKTQDQTPLLIEVSMRGRVVRARAWIASVGRIRIYL